LHFAKLPTIGILGGGQLARMTLEAAMRLGVRAHILDRDTDAPAAHYTSHFTNGDTTDYDTVMRFASGCDAITIDSEHVNAAALADIAKTRKIVAPSGSALATIQNKCRQKEFFKKCGVPTASFQVFADADSLRAANITYPCILKKATAGYDGYGVKILHAAADLFDGELLVEEKIEIAKEIAVLVATDSHGNSAAYEPVEMVFDPERNILKYQICPANVDEKTLLSATQLALMVADAFKSLGLLAVEMFVTKAGEILVNEVAPRPHNSGHHTIEAAATSQYENLVRILCHLPLGATKSTTPSLMMNLLGPALENQQRFENMLARALSNPHAAVHWYGKKDLRPYRKLGHVTLTGERAMLEKIYAELID